MTYVGPMRGPCEYNYLSCPRCENSAVLMHLSPRRLVAVSCEECDLTWCDEVSWWALWRAWDSGAPSVTARALAVVTLRYSSVVMRLPIRAWVPVGMPAGAAKLLRTFGARA